MPLGAPDCGPILVGPSGSAPPFPERSSESVAGSPGFLPFASFPFPSPVAHPVPAGEGG